VVGMRGRVVYAWAHSRSSLGYAVPSELNGGLT